MSRAGGYVAAEENNPDDNDGESGMQDAITDPGKDYEPVDDPVPGGTPGVSSYDPIGMVRCRSCGMQTPADGTRCERCNTPVRGNSPYAGPKQYNGQ